jgi:hypothetical protein
MLHGFKQLMCSEIQPLIYSRWLLELAKWLDGKPTKLPSALLWMQGLAEKIETSECSVPTKEELEDAVVALESHPPESPSTVEGLDRVVDGLAKTTGKLSYTLWPNWIQIGRGISKLAVIDGLRYAMDEATPWDEACRCGCWDLLDPYTLVTYYELELVEAVCYQVGDPWPVTRRRPLVISPRRRGWDSRSKPAC